MPNTMQFPTVDGKAWSAKTVSDGGPGTGDAFLDQDGHRTWLMVVFGWLVDFIAWAAQRALGAVTATSASNVTITGNGDVTFADLPAGLGFAPGMNVNAARTSDPVNFRMAGIVKSYAAPNLVVNSQSAVGAGSFAGWTITIGGLIGPTGATGATGASGASPGAREIRARRLYLSSTHV